MGLENGGLRNLSEISAIPDSAVHRWKFSEGSGTTAADSIGSADGTINGATWVSGTWVNGNALSGDGTDDSVTSNALTTFGSEFASDAAVAFTLSDIGSGTADGDSIMGTSEGDGADQQFTISFGSGTAGAGEMSYVLRDDAFNLLRVTGQTSVDDNDTYRVVWNQNSATGAGIEFWLNGVEQTTNVQNDQGLGTLSDFTRDFPFFASNANGTITGFLDAILDDIILFSSALTQTEIEDDYNRQPWSP